MAHPVDSASRLPLEKATEFPKTNRRFALLSGESPLPLSRVGYSIAPGIKSATAAPSDQRERSIEKTPAAGLELSSGGVQARLFVSMHRPIAPRLRLEV